MSIQGLAAIYEGEEERLAKVRAARDARDRAKADYERALRTMRELEGRRPGGKGKQKSEEALQAQRDEIYRLRQELRRAQRYMVSL
jgi:hypothetical protein